MEKENTNIPLNICLECCLCYRQQWQGVWAKHQNIPLKETLISHGFCDDCYAAIRKKKKSIG